MISSSKVPLSEDTKKFHEEWNKEDCIAELRGIAEAHPEMVVTRNFFRNHSQISESTWNRYFGTFQEFKRQAGITLTRHQHRQELHVARHASVDEFRKMNMLKAGYEDKYRKPEGKTRWKTVLVGTDIHDRECDPFWRRCFLDTAKRVKPDVIVINGDAFDLPEFGKYPVDPREWDVVGRIQWFHQFLKELRKASPDSEIVLVEGNHEYRLLRHLAEASPAMRAVLSDLHGWTVSTLLGLDQFEVNFIARANLATFTMADMKKEVARNYWIGFDAVLGHHFPEGRQMGMPGWNGHHHSHTVWSSYSPVFGAYEWHQIGAGHARGAVYTAGEQWTNGLLIAHVDTRTKWSTMEYVDIRDHAVIGGKWYTREPGEVVHSN